MGFLNPMRLFNKDWDKPLEDEAELHKYGRPANATVKGVDEVQLDAGGTRTAKLSLHVTPRNEGEYDTTQQVVLPGGRIPAVGETVTIKFDPNRRRRFVLLEEGHEVQDHVQKSYEQLARARDMMGG